MDLSVVISFLWIYFINDKDGEAAFFVFVLFLMESLREEVDIEINNENKGFRILLDFGFLNFNRLDYMFLDVVFCVIIVKFGVLLVGFIVVVVSFLRVLLLVV